MVMDVLGFVWGTDIGVVDWNAGEENFFDLSNR
jgi:hypothetical protein